MKNGARDGGKGQKEEGVHRPWDGTWWDTLLMVINDGLKSTVAQSLPGG